MSISLLDQTPCDLEIQFQEERLRSEITRTLDTMRMQDADTVRHKLSDRDFFAGICEITCDLAIVGVLFRTEASDEIAARAVRLVRELARQAPRSEIVRYAVHYIDRDVEAVMHDRSFGTGLVDEDDIIRRYAGLVRRLERIIH